MDIALSADETTLAAWVQLVRNEAGPELFAGQVSSQLTWILERTAYSLLAQRLDRDDLPLGGFTLSARGGYRYSEPVDGSLYVDLSGVFFLIGISP